MTPSMTLTVNEHRVGFIKVAPIGYVVTVFVCGRKKVVGKVVKALEVSRIHRPVGDPTDTGPDRIGDLRRTDVELIRSGPRLDRGDVSVVRQRTLGRVVLTFDYDSVVRQRCRTVRSILCKEYKQPIPMTIRTAEVVVVAVIRPEVVVAVAAMVGSG